MKVVICFITALLIGCSPNPKVIVKEVTKREYPPEALMIECFVVAPPDPEAYAKGDPMEKEKLLIEQISLQYNYLEICNNRIKGLITWRYKQQQLPEQ